MSYEIEMANMLQEAQASIMQWHFNQLKEYITKQLDDIHERIQELKETMDIM
jgi:protein associated with RNAse G/E